MKKNLILIVLQMVQERTTIVKEITSDDPYFEAYTLNTQLSTEVIDILKTNNDDKLLEEQLKHWLDRQESAGKPAKTIFETKRSIKMLDEIVKENKQMTLDDFLAKVVVTGIDDDIKENN